MSKIMYSARIQRKLLVAVAVAAIGSIAYAQQPISTSTIMGMVSGPAGERTAVCYLYNGGSTPITIVSKQLTPEYVNGIGNVVYDSCYGAIQANSICAVQAIIQEVSPGLAIACRMTVQGSSSNLRGVVQVRDLNNNVTGQVELR